MSLDATNAKAGWEAIWKGLHGRIMRVDVPGRRVDLSTALWTRWISWDDPDIRPVSSINFASRR